MNEVARKVNDPKIGQNKTHRKWLTPRTPHAQERGQAS